MIFSTRGLVLALALTLTSAHVSSAELPNKRAAPASDHARKCNVGGMEGTMIAGTTVCVKISGYVSGGVEAGNLKGPSK
jgi:hypothetical protein